MKSPRERITTNVELIPVVGYPGQQEHQPCEACGGLMFIKDRIWENEKQIRASLRCEDCGHIKVSTKTREMYRYQMKVQS